MTALAQEFKLKNSVKKLFPFLFVTVFAPHCVGNKSSKPFVYEYHLPESLVFDFTKSFYAQSQFTLKNPNSKKKNFRYIDQGPVFFLYNKKTKKYADIASAVILPEFVEERKKVDSIIWAFLGSATFYYPIKPHEAIPVKWSIRAQRHYGTISFLLKHAADLEIHIYNSDKESPFYIDYREKSAKDMIRVQEKHDKQDIKMTRPYRPPDAKISSIRVIPCRHADFCKPQKKAE